MKPTFDFNAELIDNKNKFLDPFFSRFQLRHAQQELKLSESISKNYLFPTFYSEVSCAIGIFLCDYERAQAALPDPALKPVRMTLGRSLVAFSCYEYKNVLGIPSYNEIAMTIPVMLNPTLNIPVLPMIMSESKLFKNQFGYYVFGMPVTSKENQIRGNKIWGLPKITHEIEISERSNESVTIARDESGTPYFELHVPMTGTPENFDVSANLYSKLGDKLLQSQTCFKAEFNVNKYMNLLFKKNVKPDRKYLKIGEGPSAKILRDLKIDADYAENSSAQRAQSLETLAVSISNTNTKQFIVDTANDHRKYGLSARGDYGKLYMPLREAIELWLEKISLARGDVNQGVPPSDLEKILAKDVSEQERFISLIAYANKVAHDQEMRRAEDFTQDLKHIRSLLLLDETVATTNLRLGEIEQTALTAKAPSTEIHCFATTQYSGSLVNGKSETSIRCE